MGEVYENVKCSKRNISAICVCGPSGAGKSTLFEQRLLAEYPSNFGLCVSHTTREKRDGEIDKKDYHFISDTEMSRMIKNAEFVEKARVHGNWYGTSFAAVNDVIESGRVVLFVVDVQGAGNFKASLPEENTLYIFLLVPDPWKETLRTRLLERGESESEIEKRLATASREMEFVVSPGNGGFWDYVVCNDDIDVTYSKILSILRKYMPMLE